MRKECRCCKNLINEKPVLTYHNLPEKVQGFDKIGDPITDKAIDLEIYECPYCGLIQVLQEPVDYYRDVIRAIAVSEDMREFRNTYFKDFVDSFDLADKKIIEIGCGCGEYIDIMKQFAGNVYGIEHKAESVKSATDKGLKVFESFVETSDTVIPEGPYDAFYIMNFLEHIPNLSEFLGGIYNNLTDEGCGLVEVPNGDFVIKSKMFSEFMLEHVTYFTKDTLKRTLENNGFEVLSCESIWHDYILSAKVRKRKSIDLSSFDEHKNKLIGNLRDMVKRAYDNGEKIAVWGAGHQALTLLALADIGQYVSMVIDSAPFKQNCITPVSHIPIYGSEAIRDKGISYIIIMAGSYSDEISKIIKKDFPGVKGIKYEEEN